MKFNANKSGNYTNYVVVDLNNGSGNVSDNASYDIEKFSQVISVEDIVLQNVRALIKKQVRKLLK